MEIEKSIWIEGLKNAIKFGGKAQKQAIIRKLIAIHENIQPKLKEIMPKINSILTQINNFSIEVQEKKLFSLDPTALKDKGEKIEEFKTLPELVNIDKVKKVVMRLAPYPSGALHIGNARMIVLNDEYVKRYNGELILFYDDTIGSPKVKRDDPKAKFVLPEAYNLIKDGLDWLGVKYHKEFYKSDRLDIYYKYCRQLLTENNAYICLCKGDDFREKYKKTGKDCPHRNSTPEKNLEGWEKMLNGDYPEMAAVIRLKTGMDQKDPALRDQIIMRISDAEHPRVGTKYRVWPMLEFSWGIDDYLIGVTHILRGSDLMKEDIIEKFIWDIFNWKYCEFLHYGRINFPEKKLSKTLARNAILQGTYKGWDDPRTWSLQSLEKRGIKPEALRETLFNLGLSLSGIAFSDQWLYAKNSELLDSVSNRYFFVNNPILLIIEKVPFEEIIAKPLLLPTKADRGRRKISCKVDSGKLELFISKRDALKINETNQIRLKDLLNINIFEISKKEEIIHYIKSEFLSKKLDRTLKIIHWVPRIQNIKVKVLKPDGLFDIGYGELNLFNIPMNEVIQFERYGFVNPLKLDENELFCYFTH